MKTDKAAWTAAGDGVGLLRADIKRSGTALEQGQSGLVTAGGVESAAAQKQLYRSWKDYLADVNGRCGRLSELLEKTGNDEYKNDEAVQSAFRQLGGQYQDTPATGGQSRGR
ncbi:hypothetical protein ACIBJC_22750 [Streptomyces sp. NPDC050509]|uniref:hypothetical protein n=1 Tax=Streptomyces sp. NPDC050509 TaxID=3365620 RepID=UPI0037A1C76E